MYGKNSFNEATKEFHLQNDRISYILYHGKWTVRSSVFWKAFNTQDSFQHFIQMRTQSHTAYVYENDFLFTWILSVRNILPMVLQISESRHTRSNRKMAAGLQNLFIRIMKSTKERKTEKSSCHLHRSRG